MKVSEEIVLIASCKEQLSLMLEDLCMKGAEAELTINTDKTELIINGVKIPITVKGKTLE